jgi:hypothetical protein
MTKTIMRNSIVKASYKISFENQEKGTESLIS